MSLPSVLRLGSALNKKLFQGAVKSYEASLVFNTRCFASGKRTSIFLVETFILKLKLNHIFSEKENVQFLF